MNENFDSIWSTIDNTIDEITSHLEVELLESGRRIIPTLTPEDMLQPNDYPELENNPYFRYDEGMLAGAHTIKMALRALKKDLTNNLEVNKKL
ncbi:MAG: hypothetical protein VX777_03205 [Chlamydiota bacterium]|nr:hypothetical protein [Chlamydiota bacterium]